MTAVVRPRAYRQRAFSLVEVLITTAIFGLLLTLISQVFWQQYQASERVRLESQTQSVVQLFHNKLERSLALSKRILANDSVGQAYLDKLEGLAEDVAILPTIRPFGALAPTKTCDKEPQNFFWPLAIGNSLFHVEVAKTVDKYGAGILNRKLDLYQFVLYYPVQTTTKLRGSNTFPVLEIHEWRSFYYLDYNDYKDFMATLTGGQRTSVYNTLNALGVEALWDTKVSVITDAFWNFTTNPATATKKGGGYDIRRLHERNALMFKNTTDTQISLAYNTNTSAGANFFPTRRPVPRFYKAAPVPNASTCGAQAVPTAVQTFAGNAQAFPGGFEVGIVGGSSSREILISTAIVSSSSKARTENYDEVILTSREF